MSFGKLYTFEVYFTNRLIYLSILAYIPQGNARSTAIRAVAKENKLDVEVVNTTEEQRATTDYHKLNKLGKVPTFVGADGYELTEAIAIAIYCMSGSMLFTRSTFLLMRDHTYYQLSLSENHC